MATEKILVLGIGNDILTDDGIGPKLVGELRKMDFPADITFKTASVGGLEILEMISGFSRVFLIDAIRTKNGKPGTVYFLPAEDFSETQNLTNLHDVNFLTALELGSKLNFQIPGEIMDYTVINTATLKDNGPTPITPAIVSPSDFRRLPAPLKPLAKAANVSP